jgi:cob(I)alamin adenosyltransferase
MSISTGQGDSGTTRLVDGSTVGKDHPLLQAEGCLDELSCQLGLAGAEVCRLIETRKRRKNVRLVYGHLLESLEAIQRQLFTVGAMLSADEPPAGYPPVDDSVIDAMAKWMETTSADLPPLVSFLLPGGCELGARLHLARAIARRAERKAVAAVDATQPGPARALRYLNRLSDLLFVLARAANADAQTPEPPLTRG